MLAGIAPNLLTGSLFLCYRIASIAAKWGAVTPLLWLMVLKRSAGTRERRPDLAESYITEEMRATLGKERDKRVSFPVDKSAIRQWAIAINWPEPPDRLYWDEEYAKKTRFGGIIAPPYFNPFAYHVDEQRMRGPATRPQGSTVPGTRSMNGGGEAEYFAPIRPGDVITSVNSVVDYTEREGRLGRMLFTIAETRWTNQQGELVRVYRATNIRY